MENTTEEPVPLYIIVYERTAGSTRRLALVDRHVVYPVPLLPCGRRIDALLLVAAVDVYREKDVPYHRPLGYRDADTCRSAVADEC